VGVLVTITVGLVFWIASWAIGLKAFTGFMVVILLAVVALTARIVTPWAKAQLGR
jgi:uncharacterized membrane protein